MRSLSIKTMAIAFIAFGPASAAEIRVLTQAPVKSFLQEVANAFERLNPGTRVIVETAAGQELVQKVNGGQPYDCLLTNAVVTKQITGLQATVVALSQAVIAYRKGAPKPDAGSSEEVKSLVARVKRLSFSDPALGGSSSVFFQTVSRELGIQNEVEGKSVVTQPGQGAAPVNRGEAEIGVAQLGETLSLTEVETTPLLPNDPRSQTPFLAGVAPHASNRGDAKKFVDFLTSDQIVQMKGSNGLI